MHAATTRSIIAAAGLAAIGLVAFPQQAQHAVPTVHRDVALVDDFTTLLSDEGTFDNALFNDVLGPTGAEEVLFTDLSTALGGGSTGASEATTLLDATGASPIFSGDFDGAESRLFEGFFLDTLASEDQLNQLLGATPTESEDELLSVFNTDFVPLPPGTTDPVVVADFDTDLTSIANADYTLAGGDFEGFLANLATDTSGLSDVSTLLTDLSSSFSDLSSLSPDLSTILTDLTGLL